MSEKNFIEQIESAQIDYLAALSRGSGAAGARDRLKNVLFTFCGEIMEALRRTAELEKANAKLAEDLDALDAALAEADKENVELKKAVAEKKARSKKTGE